MSDLPSVSSEQLKALVVAARDMEQLVKSPAMPLAVLARKITETNARLRIALEGIPHHQAECWKLETPDPSV